MSPEDRTTLLIISLIAVVAPVIAEMIPRVRLPVIVLEIALGLIVGPQILGWAEPRSEVIEALSRFGVAFLFFIAGLEIDFQAIRGRPLTTAVLGWLLSLGIALAVGLALMGFQVVGSGVLLAGALTTTALGTLIPILRDEGETDTRFGRFVVAAGALGEFGPIVLISAILSSGGGGEHGGEHGGGGPITLVLLLVFAGISVAAAFIAARALPAPVVRLLERKMHTSSQLPVRVAFLLLLALVLLTRWFKIDAVLGAIAAGLVVGLACKGHAGEVVRHKLEGIAYGFFVPIFFITSGMKFDLHALTGSVGALVRVPLFLLLFLLARGAPVLLMRRDLPRGDRLPMALLSATALPLVVVIAEVGVDSKRLEPENAAALVGAGMVSVLLFPMLALSLRGLNAPLAAEAGAIESEHRHGTAPPQT